MIAKETQLQLRFEFYHRFLKGPKSTGARSSIFCHPNYAEAAQTAVPQHLYHDGPTRTAASTVTDAAWIW